MKTKIYAHTDYILYCPKCLNELWDGERLKIQNISCFRCGSHVEIDYESGHTFINKEKMEASNE